MRAVLLLALAVLLMGEGRCEEVEPEPLTFFINNEATSEETGKEISEKGEVGTEDKPTGKLESLSFFVNKVATTEGTGNKGSIHIAPINRLYFALQVLSLFLKSSPKPRTKVARLR